LRGLQDYKHKKKGKKLTGRRPIFFVKTLLSSVED